MLELFAALLIVIGAGLVLVGSLGLLRLPDFYCRLHAPTKAATLGLAALLGAATVHGAIIGGFTPRDFLITLFLFITAPVSALILGRAAIHRGVPSRARPPQALEGDRNA